MTIQAERSFVGTRLPSRAGRSAAHEDWVLAIPGDLLEPHPLVVELRHALRTKEAALADKDREIARLEVALAFGMNEFPRAVRRPQRDPSRRET